MTSKNTPKERRIILKHADDPNYSNRIGCYLREGGYEMLRKAVKMKPEEIGEEVLKSGVRGRGGAGFPAGMKWKFLDRKSGKPIYLICNADESEPGTFKDRQIMHKDPHQLIEGMMIAAYAIQANRLSFTFGPSFSKEPVFWSEPLPRPRKRASAVKRFWARTIRAIWSFIAELVPRFVAKKPG